MENLSAQNQADWSIISHENGGGDPFKITITNPALLFERKQEDFISFETFESGTHTSRICTPLGIDPKNLQIIIYLTINKTEEYGSNNYTFSEQMLASTTSTDIQSGVTKNGIIIIMDTDGNLLGGRKTKGQISHPDHPIGK